MSDFASPVPKESSKTSRWAHGEEKENYDPVTNKKTPKRPSPSADRKPLSDITPPPATHSEDEEAFYRHYNSIRNIAGHGPEDEEKMLVKKSKKSSSVLKTASGLSKAGIYVPSKPVEAVVTRSRSTRTYRQPSASTQEASSQENVDSRPQRRAHRTHATSQSRTHTSTASSSSRSSNTLRGFR